MNQYKDEELLNKIVPRLKKLREKKDASREQVYNETAKNNLTVSTIAKLCGYFSISIAEIF